MKQIALIVAAAVLAGSPAASGQTPAAGPLTLDQAIALGLQASHRLEELQAREDVAAALVEQQRAADRPLVALQGGYTRTNHIEEFGIVRPDGTRSIIFPDLPDNYRARLDLQWPIYSGGRVAALLTAATAERDAAGHDAAAAREDLRLEVTRAFWALVTARETARVVEEATRRMDVHLDAVRSQLAAGFIPPNDVLSVEAARSRQQLLFLEARNAAEIAAADLRRLLGFAPDAPIQLAATLDPPAPAPAIEALIDDARKSRVERQALERRAAAFAARRNAASAGLRPTVAVVGGMDYASPNRRILPPRDAWQESWEVGVNASWPIWDGGRTRAGMAEAAAAERAARKRLDEFDAALELDVRQRRLDLEAALLAIEVADEGIRSAAEARRVVGERFDAGVATSVDVLDAQVALLQAELDRTRALAGARLAAARLRRSTGGSTAGASGATGARGATGAAGVPWGASGAGAAGASGAAGARGATGAAGGRERPR
jgi:outer membrane protein TolC